MVLILFVALLAGMFVIMREKVRSERNFVQAEHNFRDAQRAVDRFGVELAERLSDVSGAAQVRRELLPALELLAAALENRAAAFWDVMKIGRTHLQDATPMRLGQEFGGYAQQVRSCAERLTAALTGILGSPSHTPTGL